MNGFKLLLTLIMLAFGLNGFRDTDFSTFFGDTPKVNQVALQTDRPIVWTTYHESREEFERNILQVPLSPMKFRAPRRIALYDFSLRSNN